MKTETIKHHLPDSVLAAYSAGTLPEAFSLIVASHISLCDDCRAQAASYDAVGGVVLEEMQSVELAPGALAATMALIEASDGQELSDTKPVAIDDPAASTFPAPLREYVGGGPEKVRWRKVGGGIKQAVLPCDGDATARLLYIPAGMAVPDHTHQGLELTMVLQGSFSDEVDQFRRGDVELGDDDLTHTPVADAGVDCICIAATEAPLKFNSFLPRLLQPFLRI